MKQASRRSMCQEITIGIMKEWKARWRHYARLGSPNGYFPTIKEMILCDQNGIRFLAIDNSTYQINDGQFAFYK